MNREQIHNLMNLLGVSHFTDRSDWVGASCPFASKTHANKRDEHPSFGISIGPSSWVNCFACGISTPLRFLPNVYRKIMGKNNPELSKFILLNGDVSVTYKPIGEEMESDLLPSYLSENVFNTLFIPLKIDIRGIKEPMRKLYRLMLDPNEQRLIIPIMDITGGIVGIKGRALRKYDNLRHKFYSDLFPFDPKRLGVWYGMHVPRKKGKAIVLTEGEIDCIRLKQEGVSNVWACMGVGISSRQVQTLVTGKGPYIFFFDDDMAGDRLKKKLIGSLKGVHILYEVKNYAGCKDADEIIKAGDLPKALRSIEKII